MNHHALQVLEFTKIKEILSRFCISPLGKESVESLVPKTNRHTIQQELDEVSEMIKLYHARQEPPTDGIYDIRDPLSRSQVEGAMLDPAEIILIRDTAIAARRIKQALKSTSQNTKLLKRYSDRLVVLPELERAVDQVFDEQSNLRDNATPELNSIRKNLRQQRQQIVHRLERLIRGGWKTYLIEDLYTVREGRYVLPVDARFQSKVKGIIHGRSGTSNTVYIEPMEIVHDGNLLKDMQRSEDMEIRRILRELTSTIANFEAELKQNLYVFQYIDFLTAKARFCIEYDFQPPNISPTDNLHIKNGRHPLLLIQSGKGNVIPLNLEMKPGIKGLVITGPNTGGKTVVLKTVGLICMMAQAGLHIPADPNTELPVYNTFGADIGDEQSLEQSLSTFSSHMKNICDILEQADKNSLVLLDELGSGTDPIEGGALSCAILERLYKQNATFLISTHLQDLKLFAHKNKGIENGAMEFDLKTLRPTFAFTMGLPGQSNAIDIAGRLGVPKDVIHSAREQLKQRDETPEELLFKLGEETRTAQSMRELREEKLAKAQKYHEDSERRIENAKRQAQDIIKRAEKKAQKLIDQFEARLKDLELQEKEFQKQWEDKLNWLIKQSDVRTNAQETLKDLKKELQQTKQEIKPENVTKPKPAQQKKYIEQKKWNWDQLKPGSRVRVLGFKDEAIVNNIFPKKNEVEVSVSSMNFRVRANRIEAILKEKPKGAVKIQAGDVRVDRPSGVSSSIDVHGMTVDEMSPLVETYIDQAFRAGLPSVRIVHGHGFGILRKAVRNMLRDHPLVHQYAAGEDYEGGTGVTVAKLRRSL